MKFKEGDVVTFLGISGLRLTNGKNYPVICDWDGDDTFIVIGDDGDDVYAIYPSCAHGKWELVTNGK